MLTISVNVNITETKENIWSVISDIKSADESRYK